MLACRPHRWRIPEVGDVALVCGRCGRVLPFAELERWHVRMGVIRVTNRLRGRERGREFAAALAEAMNADVERTAR